MGKRRYHPPKPRHAADVTANSTTRGAGAAPGAAIYEDFGRGRPLDDYGVEARVMFWPLYRCLLTLEVCLIAAAFAIT